MLTFEKFSISPIKVRVLFIKKLLNELGYNLEETFIEDKAYKKALRKYQIDNGFAGNCVVSNDVFHSFIQNVKSAESVWNMIKSR